MGDKEQIVYLVGPNGERRYSSGEYETLEALRSGFTIDEEQPNGATGVPVYTLGGVKMLGPKEAEEALRTTGAKLSTMKALAEQREREIAEQKAERDVTQRQVEAGLLALLLTLVVLFLLKWRSTAVHKKRTS